MINNKEYYIQRRKDMEEVSLHSKSCLVNANELVGILYDFEDPRTNQPRMDVNIYFGEERDCNSKYVLRLFQPFDAAGLIVLINKTLGGDLYAKECRDTSKEDVFIADCINEFIKKRFTKRKDGMFFIDYGWYKYEIEIQEMLMWKY